MTGRTGCIGTASPPCACGCGRSGGPLFEMRLHTRGIRKLGPCRRRQVKLEVPVLEVVVGVGGLGLILWMWTAWFLDCGLGLEGRHCQHQHFPHHCIECLRNLLGCCLRPSLVGIGGGLCLWSGPAVLAAWPGRLISAGCTSSSWKCPDGRRERWCPSQSCWRSPGVFPTECSTAGPHGASLRRTWLAPWKLQFRSEETRKWIMNLIIVSSKWNIQSSKFLYAFSLKLTSPAWTTATAMFFLYPKKTNLNKISKYLKGILKNQSYKCNIRYIMKKN